MTQPISTGGPEGGGVLGLGLGGIAAAGGSSSGSSAIGTGAALATSSSFGVDATTLSPDGFKARSFLMSERVRMLSRRESYFKSTHHDWKMFDFDGRVIPPGPPTSQPMLAAEQSAHYVPLRLRRPIAPYRLPRTIVSSFTSLLFGHGRWPKVRMHGDDESEDFCRALAKACDMRTVMIRARNIGGSVGTVGLSWRFYDGKPKVQVHNGKHLFVHSWADREELIPEHVSEVYTYSDDVYDEEKKQYVRKWFWHRRDWTPVADVAFLPVEFDQNRDPEWTIDEDPERTVEHGDGRCHFVWVQNLPEDDGSTVDGQPDYAELYESFEAIDLLKSVVVRGATLNLDPTLVLKLDPDIVQRTGIKKGSDNSLLVGLSGDAKYMELGGGSINVGSDLIKKLRDAALETAQCVVPDPDKIGAAAHSSPALKVIYEPMLSKTDILRVQYGTAIERLLSQMCDAAREYMGRREVTEEGAEIDVVFDLPMRVETVAEYDEDGAPTGNEIVTKVPRRPGEGGEIELDWPDYFSPTTQDRLNTAQMLGAAVVNKVVPHQTAVEEMALLSGRNPGKEWERVTADAEAVAQAQMAMFPDAGEPVSDEATDEAAPDEAAATNAAGVASLAAEAGEVVLGVSDTAKIVTVNEARKAIGLAPLATATGALDPDGFLTVAEFAAKRAAAGQATGKVVGEVEGQQKAGIPTAAETAAAEAATAGGQTGLTPPSGGDAGGTPQG